MTIPTNADERAFALRDALMPLIYDFGRDRAREPGKKYVDVTSPGRELYLLYTTPDFRAEFLPHRLPHGLDISFQGQLVTTLEWNEAGISWSKTLDDEWVGSVLEMASRPLELKPV